MSVRDRWLLALLIVDAVVLAVVELLFLPLRFDGYLLPYVLGGVPVPLTPLLAALTNPLLVSLAARLAPGLGVAAAPLIAWVVTLAVFGMFGPGGDIVLVSDWLSLLLFACGALPGAVALGKVLATTFAPPR